MAKFDGIKGQELLDVEDDKQKNEITLIFKDNRFLFVKVEDGKTCMRFSSRMNCILNSFFIPYLSRQY